MRNVGITDAAMDGTGDSVGIGEMVGFVESVGDSVGSREMVGSGEVVGKLDDEGDQDGASASAHSTTSPSGSQQHAP